jgi:hypothetical protein
MWRHDSQHNDSQHKDTQHAGQITTFNRTLVLCCVFMLSVVITTVSMLSVNNVLKLFTSLIYKCLYQARVFVSAKPLQPGLMFMGKARSLTQSKVNFTCSTLG